MLRKLKFIYPRTLVQNIKMNQSQTIPYMSALYEHWQKDHNSVGESWDRYFSTSQPIQAQQNQQINSQQDPEVIRQIELMYKCYAMFRNYFNQGHLLADLDPLNLQSKQEYGLRIPDQYDISLDIYQFTEQDLDYPLYFGDVRARSLIHPFMVEKEAWTIREMLVKLNKLYRGRFGIEYMHIVNEEEKLFLEQCIVDLAELKPSKLEQSKTLSRLTNAHAFNEFLKTKFPTSKRFGVEGNDTLISGLGALVDQGAEEKIQNIVFGMAHRGRLSTLANVFKKPMEVIFAEFQNKQNSEALWGNSGDVKYHLGTTLKKNYDGHSINMIMLPNPSHLEAVNPVVSGKTRSIQELCKQQSDPIQTALAIIIHGDASIAGQGVVYEHMQMQNLEGYSVKGSIHIVVNNQIGFTTTPIDGRSGIYCTEVAKSIDAPIIHVNGDDADLVDAVMRQAVKYRNRFQKDIVIDLIGYRRFGHNEQDQPAFTQPSMYKQIEQIKPVFYKYTQQLLSSGVFNQHEIDQGLDLINQQMEQAYKNSRRESFNFADWTTKADDKMIEITKYGKIKDTGVPIEQLKAIGQKLTQLPINLEVHPTLKRIYEQRAQSIQDGKGIDFATAESLAYATLIDEGFSIRLSGQDVERGTFSQRHCVLNDQKQDIKYYPQHQLLQNNEKQRFQVYNSLLSEYAVLGFEYGYSLSNPNTLVAWEAQFGDFANGAQIMIDNFISSGETKWLVQSGLVMLLPHGMDGMGPEHSSARIERYLQSINDDPQIVLNNDKQSMRKQLQETNMQICVVSNAANYFHVLRRQLRREFRKPLILFNSKRLLKSPKASSDIDLFKEQTRFRRVIDEESQTLKPFDQIKKVIICYGQIYYDILERRTKLGRDDAAIIRLEQLAPFPYENFKCVATKYKNAEFILCQEEHQNAGGWQYLEPRVNAVLQKLKEQNSINNSNLSYCGRRPSSSTATGSHKIHTIELEKVLEKLFS